MKKERPCGKDMFQGKTFPPIDPEEISNLDPVLGELLRQEQDAVEVFAKEEAFFAAMGGAYTLGFEGALEASPPKINICDPCGYAGRMASCPGCGIACKSL